MCFSKYVFFSKIRILDKTIANLKKYFQILRTVQAGLSYLQYQNITWKGF